MSERADSEPTSRRRAPPTRKSFTEGPVGKHLIRLGSFMTVGSVSLIAAQMAETVFVGFLGTQALAAMGYAFPLTMTLFSFAGGIGTGASSVTARAYGAGDRSRSATLVTHAQILAVGVGIVLGFVYLYFTRDVAMMLGATGETLELTVSYLSIYLLGFPFFMLSIVGSTLLRATGSAASPGLAMTVSSLLQVLLAWLLVFGHFGLPELGIEGAAWAYAISRAVSSFVYIYLLYRNGLYRLEISSFAKSCKDIMYVGGPVIASGLVMPAGMFIITWLLSRHGDAAVAGYNVANRVEAMAHMILWSASSSVEPFIGQNWGGALYDRAKRALSLTHRFCLAWGVLMFGLLATFGPTLVGAIDDNPEVVAVATAFFLFIPLSIGFMGMTQTASACFNALGKPTPSLVISMLRALVIYIPLALIGDYFWGYVGIFVATALTNIIVGLFAWRWNWSFVRTESARLETETIATPRAAGG